MKNSPNHRCIPSTVSREIRRNSGGWGYRYKQAQVKAEQRRLLARKYIKIDASMNTHGNVQILVEIFKEKVSPLV